MRIQNIVLELLFTTNQNPSSSNLKKEDNQIIGFQDQFGLRIQNKHYNFVLIFATWIIDVIVSHLTSQFNIYVLHKDWIYTLS